MRRCFRPHAALVSCHLMMTFRYCQASSTGQEDAAASCTLDDEGAGPFTRPQVFNPFSRRMVPVTSKFASEMLHAGFVPDSQRPMCFALGSKPATMLELPKPPQRKRKTKAKVSQSGDDDNEKLNASSATTQPGKKWAEVIRDLVTGRSDAEATASVERFLADAHDVRSKAHMPPRLLLAAQESGDDANISDLTEDQSHARDLAARGYHLYIGGSAGTGKTIALRAIASDLRSRGLNVICTATTGVAAVQLGGVTLHSALGVPMKTGQKWDTNTFRAADVLIIDEVSLLDLTLFEAIDATARTARLNDAAFGGIQVILCGDFLQLSMELVSDTPCYKSSLFRHFVSVQLTTTMRQRDMVLLSILQKLRTGQFDDRLLQLDNVPVEEEADATFLFPRRRQAAEVNEKRLSAIDGPEEVFAPHHGPWVSSPSVTPTCIAANIRRGSERKIVDAICMKLNLDRNSVSSMQSRLQEDKFCFRARLGESVPLEAFRAAVNDCVAAAGGAVAEWVPQPPQGMAPLNYSMALVDGSPASIAPIRLKVGCRVMVLRNLSRTITNGTLGTVEGFAKPDTLLYPESARLRTSQQSFLSSGSLPFPILPVIRLADGTRLQIPPVSDVIGGTADTFFYGQEVMALPLALGYAFTVHKVQGVTLEGRVVIDCEDMFNCDHLVYVACSRVRKLSQLSVRNIDAGMVQAKASALEFTSTLPPSLPSSLSSADEAKPRGAWVVEVPH